MLSAPEVKDKYGDLIMSIPGVIGVGCPDGKFCVYVKDEKTMELLKKLFVKKIAGVIIIFRLIGNMVAYGKS